MDTALNFNTVHIIEWLKSSDRRTGWNLYRELEPITPLVVSLKYWSVLTRDEFIALLRSFVTDIRENGRLPILQIETHGNAQGIGISEEQSILWRNLMDELIPINEAMRLNLFVILACCEGVWGIQMLQPIERAAFRAMIGPNRTLTDNEVQKASIKFFQTMFEDRSAVNGFRAMNDVIDPQRMTFSVVTAEMAFRGVYQEYLKNHCTEEQLAAREERIAAQMEPLERDRGSSEEQLNQSRMKLQMFLRDHRLHFEDMRRKFFFVDQYPENDLRFNISFEHTVVSSPTENQE
jgi:hypothetical protein